MRARKEVTITIITLIITAAGGVWAGWALIDLLISYINSASIGAAIGQGLLIVFAAFLVYSSIVYQLARLGHYARQYNYRPASTNGHGACSAHASQLPVVFLIPSYKEEVRVIRQALVSAALQEHPHRRVVLLIDDPPDASSDADNEALAMARQLPVQLQQVFDLEADKYRGALAEHEARMQSARENDLPAERELLAGLYLRVADWFQDTASRDEITDHTDRLFAEKILLERSRRYREMAETASASTDYLRSDVLDAGFRRLAELFDVTLSSFERKRYVNLSHESNKAMNLNSYIGLIGNSYREIRHEDGIHLEPAPQSQGTLHFPEAEYVITLDADSLLLPDYTSKLICILEQPGNTRVAVIQTPYSAIPNPESIVERIAGATTDIQHIIHQGFTSFNATYWVGANAILRKKALDDICIIENERGFAMKKYIQDRTVIEDTESSIDLVSRGWSLYNFPERLTFSATPPDFGSLLIQRRRWANGGFIILPKLLRVFSGCLFRPVKFLEFLMRYHYLVSIGIVSFGLLLMLVYPFESSMRTLLLPLACLPYFYLYRRDLMIIGYRGGDFLRVYALNLMLLPVNLAGVFRSFQQVVFRRKSQFGRTPKVRGRTRTPALYIVILYALTLLCLSAFIVDMIQGRYPHGIFCGINCAFFVYVIIRYLGPGNAWDDLMDSSVIRSMKEIAANLKGAYQSQFKNNSTD